MNKLLRHTLAATIAAVIAVSLASCRSSRQVTAPASTPANAMAADWSTGVKNIASAYGNWQQLRLPVKIELKSPKTVSISGTATMIRDRAIHISLRYIGFEVGWMYLTSDSITIADKYHKRYMTEAFRPFLAGAPVTIANVQDLLLGRMFEMGSATALTPAQASKGTADIDGMYYFLPREEASNPFSCGFAFIPSASDISPMMLVAAVIAGKGEPIEVKYGSTAATEAGPMSASATLSYTTGKTPVEATLRWNFDKSRWGADVELPSTSVRGYSRVTLDMITAMISKL